MSTMNASVRSAALGGLFLVFLGGKAISAEAPPETAALESLKNVAALMKGNEAASGRTRLHFTLTHLFSDSMRKRLTEARSSKSVRILMDESDLDVLWMQDGGKLFTTMVVGNTPPGPYGNRFQGYSAGGVSRVLFEEVKGGIIDLNENVNQRRYTYNPWSRVLKNAKGEWWSDFILANPCTLRPATLPEMIKEDRLEITATRVDGTLFTLTCKPSQSFLPTRIVRTSVRHTTDEDTRIEWQNSPEGPQLKHAELMSYYLDSPDAWLKTVLDVKEANTAVEDLDHLAKGIFPEGTTVNDKITNLIFTAGSDPAK